MPSEDADHGVTGDSHNVGVESEGDAPSLECISIAISTCVVAASGALLALPSRNLSDEAEREAISTSLCQSTTGMVSIECWKGVGLEDVDSGGSGGWRRRTCGTDELPIVREVPS